MEKEKIKPTKVQLLIHHMSDENNYVTREDFYSIINHLSARIKEMEEVPKKETANWFEFGSAAMGFLAGVVACIVIFAIVGYCKC